MAAWNCLTRMAESNFRVLVVWLVLSGRTEEALELLAKEYQVSVPMLKVGLPKGHKTTAYGCYTAKTHTISVLNSDILTNPFVIIHEFYHHLRSKNVDRVHRGTEGNADKFAAEFITQYQAVVKRLMGQ
jgi:Zn-dependent peptidase ImmA (M78 family)